MGAFNWEINLLPDGLIILRRKKTIYINANASLHSINNIEATLLFATQHESNPRKWERLREL